MAQQTTQISTVNPATEEIISNYTEMTKDQVVKLVKQSRWAFDEWKIDSEKRRGVIYNLAEYLKENKMKLAQVATKEMGKVLKESISEVEKCVWALEFYADHG